MNDVDPEALARAEMVFSVWNDQGLEAMAQRFWHPDIVWEEPPHFPDAAVRHGRDEAVQRMQERLSLLGEIHIEVVSARRVGGNTLVEAIVRGKGALSGAPVEQPEYFLLTIEEGMTTRFREFLDREAALAAAGGDE